MKKIFSITVFVLLLPALSWAGGNKDKSTQTPPEQRQTQQPQIQQTQQLPPPAPVSLFWTGNGGKDISLTILAPRASGLAENQGYLPALVQGEFVSNFSGFSAISVLDRVRLEEHYAELESGIYSDNAEAGTDFGHLIPTTHLMTGTITRTATGYALQISIARNSDKITQASYSGTFTFAELDNLTGIRRASLDLLEKMGVTPTERTRTELSRGAAANHVSAQTALAQGITAQRQGTEVAALSYFFQASAFDPSLLEAVNRTSTLNANITGSNVGDNVRNDIQWRREWVQRLTETEQYFDTLNRTQSMPYTLFYVNDISQGTINYQTETVTLSIPNTNVKGSHTWAVSVERALQAVYNGLQATGRAADWGLGNWPTQRVTSLNPFTRRSQNFTVVFELLNNRNEVIGRQTLTAEGFWELTMNEVRELRFNVERTRRYPIITISADDRKPVAFPNVDANKITDRLTIRIASVNGTNAEAAARNGVLQIQAMTSSEFATNTQFRFTKGAISVISIPDPNDRQLINYFDLGPNIVIPQTIFGDPVTAIAGLRNQYNARTITIHDGVKYIGDDMRYSLRGSGGLKTVIIGANVEIVLPSGGSDWHNFVYTYQQNNRRAGTYTYPSSSWRWDFTPR